MLPTVGTFAWYLRIVINTKQDMHNWRMGQTYYNVIADVKPKLAEKVNGSPNLDPFHRDENIPEFLAFVANNWDLA